MATKYDLLYLFDRPAEPLDMVKGDGKVQIVDGTNSSNTAIMAMFKLDSPDFPVKQISLEKLDEEPDLSFAKVITDDTSFSYLRPNHSEIANKLIQLFMRAKTIAQLNSLAAYCRRRLNKHLFIFAFSVAITHRPDCKGLDLPSNAQLFPSLYMPNSVVMQARKETAKKNVKDRQPVEIKQNFTATDLEPEHKMAYFREDICVNLHHYHWHQIFPTCVDDDLNKDRRGELFYYMHEQILARYDFDRLSNGLNRVISLSNWWEPIREGYFPKIASAPNDRPYPPRFPEATLKNVRRRGENINIETLELWRDRILDAIHHGRALNSDLKPMELNIDMLGNMVEASRLSVNSKLYGNIHNTGHNLISLIHDPDNRFLEEPSVMGGVDNAMRDPIFYRWHAFVNDLFDEHKKNIPKYDVAKDLAFDDVSIVSVNVSTDGKVNELNTFWQKSDIDVGIGLNYAPPGPVYVRYTHIQHAPFTYNIKIKNNGNSRRDVTVRIFLAPLYNESGDLYTIDEQRRLFIEMDKFTESVDEGEKDVTRNSADSSVTRDFDMVTPPLQQTQSLLRTATKEDWCKCGWPSHMLVPKGTAEGLDCQLFVMVTDSVKDQPKNSSQDNPIKLGKDATSYCGLRDSLYPDSRAMGFPFDRPFVNGKTVFSKENGHILPNMSLTNVVIRFSNEYRA